MKFLIINIIMSVECLPIKHDHIHARDSNTN